MSVATGTDKFQNVSGYLLKEKGKHLTTSTQVQEEC